MTTISVKNLAALALEKLCPRCYWRKLTLSFKLPYQILPSVFNVIDGYVKRVTNDTLGSTHALPAWLAPLGVQVTRRMGPDGTLDTTWGNWRKFKMMVGDWEVRGECDELLQLPNSQLWIMDYKTSKRGDKASDWDPLYHAQLNMYAEIAEALGMGQVAKLSLVYYEPVVEPALVKIAEMVKPDGFAMGFKPLVLDVPRVPGTAQRLVEAAKRILAIGPGNPPMPDCKDCDYVQKLAQLV